MRVLGCWRHSRLWPAGGAAHAARGSESLAAASPGHSRPRKRPRTRASQAKLTDPWETLHPSLKVDGRTLGDLPTQVLLAMGV